MDNLEPLFQVIFFVVLLLGWILKTVAEQKRKPPPRPHREPSAEEHAPGAGRPFPAPTPLPPPRRAPPGPASTRHAEGTVRLPPLPEAVEPSSPVPQPPRATTGSSQGLEVAAALTTGLRIGRDAHRHRTRLRSTMIRLTGGMTGARLGDVVRAGVLWREILGPPKALQGPYRTVTSRRRPR